MNLSELRDRIEQHLSLVPVEESIATHLRSFADWIDGTQAEEAKEQEAVALLQAHGYTVTKG